MSYLTVTSAIDFTIDRAGALSFEDAANKLRAVVRATFPKSMVVTGTHCLVMLTYGASTNCGLQFRFSKTKNELSIVIPVTSAQFYLVQEAHRPLFLELLLWMALDAAHSQVGSIEDAEIVSMKASIPTYITVTSSETAYLYTLAETICLPTRARSGKKKSKGAEARKQSYTVVIQLPASVFESPEGAELETSLEGALGKLGFVDGNDVDANKYNIFIVTTVPLHAFETLRSVLENRDLLKNAKVAFAREQEDDYKVLWPSTSDFQL